MEQLQMHHLHHTIKQFDDMARKQEGKGVIKYGKPLDPMDDYNWLDMAEEEMVDGFKYIEAQRKKQQFVAYKLRKLLNQKDTEVGRTEIDHWLDVLEGSK